MTMINCCVISLFGVGGTLLLFGAVLLGVMVTIAVVSFSIVNENDDDAKKNAK